MRNATVTAVIDAPREQVFAYLADPEHLPEWATEFAREVRREGARGEPARPPLWIVFRPLMSPRRGVAVHAIAVPCAR